MPHWCRLLNLHDHGATSWLAFNYYFFVLPFQKVLMTAVCSFPLFKIFTPTFQLKIIYYYVSWYCLPQIGMVIFLLPSLSWPFSLLKFISFMFGLVLANTMLLVSQEWRTICLQYYARYLFHLCTKSTPIWLATLYSYVIPTPNLI